METEQTQVVSVPDVDRTQVGTPFGAEATQAAIRIECPVCQSSNPPGERWCGDCGFLLSGVPGEAPAEAPPLEAQPRLVAVGDGGREFVLRPGPNSVGRENTDVLLLDGTVSRRHATVTLEEGGARVEDHGSTNGTRVGGQPLPPGQSQPLYDGDEVRFGSAAFTLRLPGAAPRPADAPPMGAAAAGEERPVRARLVGGAGEELLLREGVNSLGRRSENDLVLRGDPYVSGRHAEITCGPEGCALVDVGSTNGTFLDSERLAPGDRRELADGAEVRLGQTAFRFETVAPAEVLEEPEGDAAESVDEEALTTEGAVAEESTEETR